MQRMIKTLMITLLTAASATLSAAPVGYSINSDSTTSEPDSLYTIDLSTGNVIKNIGIVQTGALVDGTAPGCRRPGLRPRRDALRNR